MSFKCLLCSIFFVKGVRLWIKLHTWSYGSQCTYYKWLFVAACEAKASLGHISLKIITVTTTTITNFFRIHCSWYWCEQYWFQKETPYHTFHTTIDLLRQRFNGYLPAIWHCWTLPRFDPIQMHDRIVTVRLDATQ